MNVLALDLATTSGWAMGDSETYPLLAPLQANVDKPPEPLGGVVQFKGKPLGSFFERYEKWLQKKTFDFRPGLIAFEAPWTGQKTSQPMARKSFGLAAITELVAFSEGIEIRSVPVGDIRMHFLGKTGKRRQMKQAAIEACECRGWHPKDDNHAEAMMLLDFTMHCLTPRQRAAA